MMPFVILLYATVRQRRRTVAKISTEGTRRAGHRGGHQRQVRYRGRHQQLEQRLCPAEVPRLAHPELAESRYAVLCSFDACEPTSLVVLVDAALLIVRRRP